MESVNETVNTALYSASHAIWGETHPEHMQHGEEPRSGVQGKGSVADPYDAGNRDMYSGLPAEPGVLATPKRYDAPEQTAAVNSQNEESQLGAATAATTSPSGFDISRIPMRPEEEKAPVGMDPVSADASALSSTLNQSNVTGASGGPLMARNTMTDSTSQGRNIGPRVGAINHTSVNPAMIGAGMGGGSAVDMSKADLDQTDDFGVSSNKAVKGLDLGGGGGGGTGDAAAAAGDRSEKSLSTPTETTADMVDSKKAYAGGSGGEKTGARPTETTADRVDSKRAYAGGSGGEKTGARPTDSTSDGGDGGKANSADDGGDNPVVIPAMADSNKPGGGNEAQDEEKIKPKSNVSKEALRGPSVPAPREQYEREKTMEIRRSISQPPSGSKNKAKNAAQGSSNQKSSALSKMKDKIGSHMHHTAKT